MKPGNLSNQVPIPAARLKLDDERETTERIFMYSLALFRRVHFFCEYIYGG